MYAATTQLVLLAKGLAEHMRETSPGGGGAGARSPHLTWPVMMRQPTVVC